jgi:hypothetical protein
MEHEITVGVQSGKIIFSFKTDREGSNLKEGLKAINQLISSHKELLQKAARTVSSSPPAVRERTVKSLSQLGIPADEKEAIVNHVDNLNRFDLFILLIHYSKEPLSYEQVMSLSKELGKPIKYNWLDSEPHRVMRKGFIISTPIPGKQEKLYSLTARGEKKAESIVETLKKKEPSKTTF